MLCSIILLMEKPFSLLLIYCASWCYVIAAYYHLSFKDWTFARAFLFAMPLVALEYLLSLHGNKASNKFMDPSQIMMFTVCCYILNVIILNTFILKQPMNIVRDGIAIVFVSAAMLISTNIKVG